MLTRVSSKSASVHAHSSPKSARVYAHSSPKSPAASALKLESKSLSELQRSKPSRCDMSEVRRLQKRHLYIGRGASRLGCARLFWATPFQVKRYGLMGTISKLEALFNSSPAMQRQLEQLSDKVFLCHCPLTCADSCLGEEVPERRATRVGRRSSSGRRALQSSRTETASGRTRLPIRRRTRSGTKRSRLERCGETFVCGSRSTRTRVARRCWSLLSRKRVHREKGTATDLRASRFQDTAEEFRNEAVENRSLCKACLRESRQLSFRSSGGRAMRSSVRSV